MKDLFSFNRFRALVIKEVIQMRRDRMTFAFMLGLPLLQLVMFGYAINSDPKNLPTAVLSADSSNFTRSFVAALENTGYFRVTERPSSEAEADRLIETGAVQFLLQIPPDFSRDLLRGARPSLVMVADATDPAATSNALTALMSLGDRALQHDLVGVLEPLRGTAPAYDIRLHRRYNPEGITSYNIVPGLIGVILTLTMVMFTTLAVTRETERGTMEYLLVLPLRPLEMMLGKIVPYVVLGYIQVVVILVAATFLFHIPLAGSLALLSLVLVVFIAENLAIGFTFSTIARTQLQAMQMSVFFFLPSVLLSGFMFPFRGMPVWAQWIGEVLPLTHFLRIVRGILLKGNGIAEIAPSLAALIAIWLVVSLVALKRYRRTMD